MVLAMLALLAGVAWFTPGFDALTTEYKIAIGVFVGIAAVFWMFWGKK